METLARTLADLSGYQGETRLPVGFDALWDARAARAAELREVLAAQAEGAPAPDHVAPVIHRDDLAELPRIAGV